jgi:hypothetical protein
MAQALGHCAVRQGVDVLFSTCTQLTASWNAASAMADCRSRIARERIELYRKLGDQLASVGSTVDAKKPVRNLPDHTVKVCMARHLSPTVISQALAQEGRQLLHLTREAFQRVVGRAAIHTTQDHEACLALDQRPHGRAIEDAFAIARPLAPL